MLLTLIIEVIEFSQKKKLLYQPPSNTENENNYESKPIGQTSSHQAYLDELRSKSIYLCKITLKN
jgi:hypothetical protein